MRNEYVRACLALISDGKDIDSVLEGLLETLKTRGHERLHKSILEGIVESLKNERKGATVTVAKNGNENDGRCGEAIEEALHKLGAPLDHAVETDPTLIGGFTVAFNHTLIDASYKERLLGIYRNIVGSQF